MVMQRIKDEYTRYLYLEEIFWQKKVGYDWFKSGEGLEEEDQIANKDIRFFQKQFTQERGSYDFSLIDHITKMVTTEDNDILGAIPDEEEIKNSLYFEW